MNLIQKAKSIKFVPFMQGLGVIILICSALIYLITPPKATAQYDYEGDDWYIKSFKTEVHLTDKDQIEVQETIHAYFNIEKHGIIRDIPEKYNSTNPIVPDMRRPVSVRSVTDQNGVPIDYEVTSEGSFKSIKIGDPDLYISGDQIYVIKYSITRAILFAKANDELYINITGTDWPVLVSEASGIIYAPTGLNVTQWESVCYTGELDSKEQACTITQKSDAISVKADQELPAYNGLSFAVKIPKGLIKEPTFWERYGTLILYNLGILLPIPTFTFSYGIWKRHGKDPKLKVIKPEFYPSKELTAGEAGSFIDNSADNIEVSATIIDLAIKGYLKIEETKKFLGGKDYIFHILDKSKDSLHPHELILLDYLTQHANEAKQVKLSSLKNNFYTNVATIKENLYQELVSKGFYTSDPRKLKGIMLSIAIVGGASTLFWLLPMLITLGAAGTGVGIFISMLIVGIFAPMMPKRTEKGTREYEYLLGLKQYIQIAEADRIKMMQTPDSPYAKAPDNNIELFEKLLPYAIVFGLEKEWGAKFEGIYSQPPEWYVGGNLNSFNTGYLMSSLTDATHNMNNVLTSTPRTSSGGFSSGFGGGGSSGGGIGGGGGHSW